MAGRQFAFDLPHREALGRGDFIVSPANEMAVGWLDRWPDWPGGGLVLHGPPGCGKTHLIHVWRARSAAHLAYPHTPIGSDRDSRAVAIDGADRDCDEAQLLHLYNVLGEERGWLLLTARRAPAHWRIGLPDLGSRLRALPAVAVQAPDDVLLAAVLAKLFADRQLRVGAAVIRYLVRRIERSFAGAQRCVGALDTAALAGRRSVTVALAREVLGETAAEDGSADHPEAM